MERKFSPAQGWKSITFISFLPQEQGTGAPCLPLDKPVKYFTPAEVFGLRVGVKQQPEKQEKIRFDAIIGSLSFCESWT